MLMPCMRCHALRPTHAYGALDLLQLCEACALAPPCAEFQHQYVGSARSGTHVCLRCAGILESQPPTTTPPPGREG